MKEQMMNSLLTSMKNWLWANWFLLQVLNHLRLQVSSIELMNQRLKETFLLRIQWMNPSANDNQRTKSTEDKVNTILYIIFSLNSRMAGKNYPNLNMLKPRCYMVLQVIVFRNFNFILDDIFLIKFLKYDSISIYFSF